jgi:hypothetical protein
MFALLSVALLHCPPAFGAADGCPQDPPKLKKPDCAESKQAGKEAECQKCQSAVEETQAKMKSWKALKQKCSAVNASCPSTQDTDTGPQRGTMEVASGNTQKASSCLKDKGDSSSAAAKIGNECRKRMESDCAGLAGQDQQDADKNKKACEDAAKDADQTAKEDAKKSQDASKQGDQNKDNAEKEKSSPPQMPQMPSPPKGDDKKPDTPQAASQPDISSAKEADSAPAAPAVESSNFASDAPANGVAFSSSGTDMNVSTIAPAGTPSFGSGSIFSPPHDSASSRMPGDTGMAGGSGNGTGGSSGGGVPSSGVATPAAAAEAAAKPEGSTNELNLSVGGKLGAPKGLRGGGESDSFLDASATANFDKDFKGDKSQQNADAGAAEEDSGYTLFKMVKGRYVELKRSGSI